MRRATGLGIVVLLTGFAHAATPTQAERQVEAAVQEALGVYLTVPERRESFEGVRLDGDRLEVWFLRPLSRGGRSAALCDGFRWLVRGRLQASTGIRALFAALPEIESVTLVFYDLETQVEPDREGRYTQKRSAAPQARYMLSRERAGLVQPAAAARALQGDTCAARGEALVDGFWAAPEAEPSGGR